MNSNCSIIRINLIHRKVTKGDTNVVQCLFLLHVQSIAPCMDFVTAIVLGKMSTLMRSGEMKNSVKSSQDLDSR